MAHASASRLPLQVPPDYDHATDQLGTLWNGRIYHTPRASARFCEDLLANGTPADIARAEKMFPGILAAQITDPEDRHYGAFKWELEMEAVEDLNAVQFLLFSLIPIVLEHTDKLRPATVESLRESIRRGLINIRRIDVALSYTNIALKDITNSCLGGELLGDAASARRGYEKMARWMEFTDRSGAPTEYNSLPYTAVALQVLHRLQKHVRDPSTRLRARLLQARLGLSAGLHLHLPTGRWAGPHSRAYHSSVIGEGGAYLLAERELESWREWIDEGILPRWMESLETARALPDAVVETSGRDEGVAISTYQTDHYALGVASRNASSQDNRYIAWQSNVFTLHYTRPEGGLPGSIFTRYLTDDHWLGWFSPGIGRSTGGLLPDEGHFQGVQDGERAIALYIPERFGARDHHRGAKGVLAVPRWNAAHDAVWIGGEKVGALPAKVPAGQTIVLATGSILLGVRPFALTDLGAGGGIELLEHDGTLCLELVNYRGPAKTFWELAWPGAFFQGHPQCGFYAEVAARAESSPAALARRIDAGRFTDQTDPRGTRTGAEPCRWTVGYARDGRELGLEVDLMDWFRTPRRWTHAGEMPAPMLCSGRARQDRSGRLEIDGIVLDSTPGTPAWLYVAADHQTVVAAYHGPGATEFRLHLPGETLSLPGVHAALVEWTPEGRRVDTL